MGTLWRVRTLMDLGPGNPGVSTHMFDALSFSSTDAATAVEAFWTAVLPVIANTVTLTLDENIYELDAGTGTPLSIGPAGGGFALTGGNSSEPLPLASQGLIAWRTSAFTAGRLLQGKTFVPVPTQDGNDNGVPTSGYTGYLADGAGALLDAASDKFVIWSRKHGDYQPVTTGAAWNEFAVLRSRRS